MERRFARQIESLPEIFEFLGEFGRENGLQQNDVADAGLMVEEVFTNQVKYHPESNRDISIRIDMAGDELVLCLTDFDVDPFDITKAPRVDSTLPLGRRRPGGLGIHFVKKMASRITYEYENRESRITLGKKVDSSRA